MVLFRLDASIRVEDSHGLGIADIVEEGWRQIHPDVAIVRHHIGVGPIPATAGATAAFARQKPSESRSHEQRAAVNLAKTLVDEIVELGASVLATAGRQATELEHRAVR